MKENTMPKKIKMPEKIKMSDVDNAVRRYREPACFFIAFEEGKITLLVYVEGIEDGEYVKGAYYDLGNFGKKADMTKMQFVSYFPYTDFRILTEGDEIVGFEFFGKEYPDDFTALEAYLKKVERFSKKNFTFLEVYLMLVEKNLKKNK